MVMDTKFILGVGIGIFVFLLLLIWWMSTSGAGGTGAGAGGAGGGGAGPFEEPVIINNLGSVIENVTKGVEQILTGVGGGGGGGIESEGMRGRVRILEGKVEDLERLVKILMDEILGMKKTIS